MPDKLRVTIIGNCQARPMADYVKLLGRNVEIPDIIITHLAKEADAVRMEKAAAQSDFIFAQLVQPNYPVKFIRSVTLKEQYGDRVFLWPNIFFKGQTPDLCYVTAAKGARVIGPLGDYHSRPMVDAWLSGKSVAATEAFLVDGESAASGLHDAVAASLDELKRREQQCDVGTADVIAERWHLQRLFFTFNHPVSDLMLNVAQQLLTCSGIQAALDLNSSHVGEPLGPFVPPAWPSIVRELGLTYRTSTSSRGVPVNISADTVRFGSGAAYYTARELIETFFSCYEAQKALLDGCRFT